MKQDLKAVLRTKELINNTVIKAEAAPFVSKVLDYLTYIAGLIQKEIENGQTSEVSETSSNEGNASETLSE